MPQSLSLELEVDGSYGIIDASGRGTVNAKVTITNTSKTDNAIGSAGAVGFAIFGPDGQMLPLHRMHPPLNDSSLIQPGGAREVQVGLVLDTPHVQANQQYTLSCKSIEEDATRSDIGFFFHSVYLGGLVGNQVAHQG